MDCSKCEIVPEGLKGDCSDEVHYPGRFGMFRINDGNH